MRGRFGFGLSTRGRLEESEENVRCRVENLPRNQIGSLLKHPEDRLVEEDSTRSMPDRGGDREDGARGSTASHETGPPGGGSSLQFLRSMLRKGLDVDKLISSD